MVGLFEYNPPLILEALERTGKLGKVKVMGFDENTPRCKGSRTAPSLPRSCRTRISTATNRSKCLNELHKGNKSVIPENKFIDIPARVIDASNVDAFSQEIKDRLGKK